MTRRTGLEHRYFTSVPHPMQRVLRCVNQLGGFLQRQGSRRVGISNLIGNRRDRPSAVCAMLKSGSVMSGQLDFQDFVRQPATQSLGHRANIVDLPELRRNDLRLWIGTYLDRRVQQSISKDFEVRLRTPLNKPRIHCQLPGLEIARIPTRAIEPLNPGKISVGRAQRNRADGRNALELVDGGH